MQLTKTTPEIFIAFLESVRRLQPATLKQICSNLSSVVKTPNIGHVRSAIAFATSYGFVKLSTGKLELEELGNRLLRTSGNSQVDFLIMNVKLPTQEPFHYLKNELRNQSNLSWQRFRKLFQDKYRVSSGTDQTTYAKTYADWLEFLRIAKIDDKGLTYAAGRVEGLEIIALDEGDELLDRNLYDLLTESHPTYHNLLDEPNRFLQAARTELNEEAKGEAFEKFVASVFSRFGFSTRIRDGSREQKLNLTFQRKGGGDVGIFCHFPIITGGETKPGCAIACEAKATEGAIGSRAVAQARNLNAKIKEAYPKYALHMIVVSGKNALYDSSGREQASPDVVHLTDEILLDLLGMQVKYANKGEKLVNPHKIMMGLDECVTSEKLEPTRQEFVKITESKIDARQPHHSYSENRAAKVDSEASASCQEPSTTKVT